MTSRSESVEGCARRVALSALAFAMLVAADARAQSRTGFAVARLEPAERGAGWFVVDGLDLRGSSRPALGVAIDYAYKPLAAYDLAGNERLALVRHQLLAHGGASMIFADRLRVALDVPVAAYQDGEDAVVSGEALKAATAPAVGDVRLAADARVLGRRGDPITVAVGARGWLPTGSRSQFTSDGSARVAPQALAAGVVGAFEWAIRAAVIVRVQGDDYAGVPIGSELSGACGAGARAGRFFVGAEAFASTVLAEPFDAHGTPVDALIGARYDSPSGLRISAGIGRGFTRGFGSPALRAVAMIEWGRRIAERPADRDGDGVPDELDACPDVPGTRSSTPEASGCPAPEPVPREDTDGDGIFDADDACPGVRGGQTADPMTSGCPPGAPRPLAVATSTEIRIGEQIQFAKDSDALLGDSDEVLSAVERVLDEHPEIKKVRVEGHTDDTGDPAYNDELSRRRAASVVLWLVDRGVDPARLLSEGFGSRRPIESNLTDEGRARNRRVAFTILEREVRRE